MGKDVFDIEIDTSDFGKPITMIGYFRELLKALWIEGEGFSGKRPFGNSGWQDDVYLALVKEGLVKGGLDEHGYLEWVNTKEANAFVLENIIEKL